MPASGRAGRAPAGTVRAASRINAISKADAFWNFIRFSPQNKNSMIVGGVLAVQSRDSIRFTPPPSKLIK
jgi:hypothetical protein